MVHCLMEYYIAIKMMLIHSVWQNFKCQCYDNQAFKVVHIISHQPHPAFLGDKEPSKTL